MKKQHSLLLTLAGVLLFSCVYGQDSIPKAKQKNDSIVVGQKGKDGQYREDQFYFGLSFNVISDRPKGVRQSGFSGGVHTGFIRDIPLNDQRNIAIGVGLGWSINTYSLNLLVSQDQDENSIFQILDSRDYNYDTNRYSTYLVEAPIQFRWRTSTGSSYKFWRIYAGLRFGYLYYFKSNFEQPGKQIVQHNVPELNRFRYGASFTFGYNTFNFNVYYSLNPFFDGETLNGQDVGLSTFKIGLMFYIL